ncbi:unnamed protein product [Chironomus riparius]|uniref:Uncharacterized protein n=1 Tax=Chironomus riparius TaxID=315576 RepID=A0A9N9WUT6_9DIPT|nr:unnamed protein product [Chironomus riparius]
MSSFKRTFEIDDRQAGENVDKILIVACLHHFSMVLFMEVW